jgi:hypothetical protein
LPSKYTLARLNTVTFSNFSGCDMGFLSYSAS